MPAPDDDVLADRYVQADETLSAAGFELVRGVELGPRRRRPAAGTTSCTGSDANWWGAGPGAHSHVGGVRWWNVKHPVRYAAALESARSPAAGRELLDERARLTERVMLGVRLREGLAVDVVSPAAREQVPQLVTWGLLDQARHRDGPAGADPARAGYWPTRSSATCSTELATLRPGSERGRSSSRSSTRTCMVVRCCRAARSARCRPSSR